MLIYRRCPYFIWNGVKSTNFGVFITKFPNIVIPAERVSFATVPGRSGSLVKTEGNDVYDDIVYPIECGVRRVSDIRRASAYLHGAGTLALPCRPGEHANGRIINQISFEQLVRGKENMEFTVNFRLHPFWIKDLEEVVIFSSSNTVHYLINEGDVPARPIIVLTGTGTGTLTINGSVTEVRNMIGNATIDSTIEETYSEKETLNNFMTGEFPIFKSGVNTISFDGDITSVKVRYYPQYRV